MVASRQVEIPFYRGIGRQRGRGFVALAQFHGRTAVPFLRNNIVPAAKRVGAELLELAAQKLQKMLMVERISRILGRQTLRKLLGCRSRRRTASSVIPAKSAKQNSRSRRNIFTTISH